MKHPGQTSTPPRVSLPPEEAQDAARKRVVKLRAVLDTLGEDDETYPTIKAALQKAEVQAQERPISEQIRITKMFISRKQKKVEQTRLETEKAKEALSRAQTEQVEQEALLADGERRLEALLAKDKVLLSPFTVPQLAITPNVQAEFSRLQGIIDSLQQELAHLRCGEHLSHTLPDDDDDMVADLPHKKTKVGRQTPPVISGCAPRTWSESRLWDPQAIQRNSSVIAMNRQNHWSIWIARRQSWGSKPSRAAKIVVATSRPFQHSRGGCSSG